MVDNKTIKLHIKNMLENKKEYLSNELLDEYKKCCRKNNMEISGFEFQNIFITIFMQKGGVIIF